MNQQRSPTGAKIKKIIFIAIIVFLLWAFVPTLSRMLDEIGILPSAVGY